jgi:WD40 repeat protein
MFWRNYEGNLTGGGDQNMSVGQPVAISGDAQVTAATGGVGAKSCNIELRNAGASSVNRTLHCEGRVTALALNADGKWLASAEAGKSQETTIKMWDTTTGSIVWKISSLLPVDCLSIDADTSLLASGGFTDNRIRIWDARTGSLKFVLSTGSDAGISSLTFGQTGKRLASAGLPSATVRLWNTTNGTLDQALANEGRVAAIAFSSDDRILAAGDARKGFIKVWIKPRP